MIHRARATGTVALSGALLIIGLAWGAAGRPVQSGTLGDNPRRNAGGSCIYGRAGQLLYAPHSASCPQRQDQLEGRSEGVPTALLDGFAPELQEAIREFFKTHSHIGDEVTRARKSMENGDRAAALAALDHVLAEVSSNKASAEALLEKVAPQRSAQ